MILVDTSVWRLALRKNPPGGRAEERRWHEARALPEVLDRGMVAGHPWVYAELLLGGLPDSAASLYLRLPQLRPVDTGALVELIEQARPRRVGVVDVGLLGATLRDGLRLWTLDAGLRDAATASRVAWKPRVERSG